MKIPIHNLLLTCALTILSWQAFGQCTADAGPVRYIPCIGTSVSLHVASNGPISAFSWSGPGGFTSFIASPAVTSTGKYTVTVTSLTGCTATDSVIVQYAPGLVVQETTSPASYCGIADGKITLHVVSGIAPFSYQYNGVQSGSGSANAATFSIPDVFSGDYSVSVTDVNGCSQSVSATVFNVFQAGNLIATPASCASDGAIGIQYPPGSGNFYHYHWSNNDTAVNIKNLSPGTYTVTATDDTGCTSIASATVPLQIGIITGKGQICPGESTTLTMNGGTFYAWSTGETTPGVLISPTSTTTYTVTVSGGAGCVATASQTVTVSGLTAKATATPSGCLFKTGKLEIEVQTGNTSGPFSYQWDNGTTTGQGGGIVSGNFTIDSLAAGTYQITISNSGTCSTVLTATINYDLPQIQGSVTQIPCDGSTPGMVDLSVSGTAPFIFHWSNGTNTKTNSNLPPGAYLVTVTNVLGCNATQTFSLVQSVLISGTITTPSCYGASNGSIDISPSGGITPYAYDWSMDGPEFPFNDPQNAAGLKAGNYTVTVSDANGCTGVQTFHVTQPDSIKIASQVVLVTCFSEANGSVKLTVTGGAGDYFYLWSDGSTVPFHTNLFAANYTVTVTDINGCTATSNATITQPPPLAISPDVTAVSCNGGSNGSIQLNITGSTPPYNWPNPNLPNLSAGTYCITVVDANGCSAIICPVVTQPALLVANLQPNPASCNASNGNITLVVTGGSPGYSYQWSNGSTQKNLVGVPAGSYSVTITDSHNCTATGSAVVTINGTQPALISGPDIHCTGTDITLNAVGGVIYLWSTGATGAAFTATALTTATYTVTVTNSDGCTSTAEHTVIVSDPPVASIDGAQPVCYGDVVLLHASGGSAYHWSNGSASSTIAVSANLTYTVTVSNPAGCTSTAFYTITTTPITYNPDSLVAGTLNCFGPAILHVPPMTGGAPPYTYLWTGPNAFSSTGLSINVTTSGTYNLIITDSKGCSLNSGPITILPYVPIIIAPPVFCDDKVSVTVSGGTPPYLYTWTNTPLTGNDLPLPPGVYNVFITDATGCTQTAGILVPPIAPPCTRINGQIWMDDNSNCLHDSGETGLGSWYVKATNGTDTYYGWSDSTGHYVLKIIPGDFQVSAIPPPNTPVLLCQPVVNVQLPTSGSMATADFAVQHLPTCPSLTVDLSTPMLRRCQSSGNFYYVSYCNNSPVPATDVYIDVNLHPDLIILSAGLPYIDLGNFNYRFQIGNLAPNACGSFKIQVFVACNVQLGQSLCSQAHIHPDTLCVPPNPLWKGAKVEVQAHCGADSLHFIIKNTGTAAMTNQLDYIVIEDGIMGVQDNSAPPLGPGDSIIISLPANGSTWRVEANQEPYFPGLSLPVVSVEGCHVSGAFSTGYLQQFPTNDADPWLDVDCTTVIGSYDPNEKQGFPVGYGPEHFIKPGDDIEYLIRFQNTGSDTAFQVIVLDTLSQWIDPTSVRPGAGSHPYQMKISGPGILAFIFPNINLPSMKKDEPGSHGFVKFRATSRAITPLNKEIRNRAAIYFDFNAAVFTNITIHRTGHNFVAVDTWQPIQPGYSVQVLPNPFQTEAVILLKGAPPQGKYQMHLYNLQGIFLKTNSSEQPQFTLQRDGLPPGMYLFRIECDGRLAGWGKMEILGN